MPSSEGILVINMKQILTRSFTATSHEYNSSPFLVSTVFFDFPVRQKEFNLFSSRLQQEIKDCQLQGGAIIKKGKEFLQYSICSLTLSKADTHNNQAKLELRFTNTPGGKILKEIATHKIDLTLNVQFVVTKQNNIYKNIVINKFDIII